MVTMKHLLLAVLGFPAFLGLASCGGSSSGGSCGSVTPCGGDVVGTWTIQSSCLENVAQQGGCPGSTVDQSTLNVTGSYAYRADLTYTLTGVLNGSATTTLPTSCLTLQGQILTCAQVQDLVTSAADPGISITCTGTSTCTCVETLSNISISDAGTYAITTGGLLTLTSSDGSDPEMDDYCINGNTLTMSPHADATMMGQAYKGKITLTKSAP